MSLRQWRIPIVIAWVAVVFGVSGIAHAQCGPVDLVFVIDTTGSMGGALNNVKAELPNIITQIKNASGGNYRLGLVEFHNDVHVLNALAAGNDDSINTGIQGFSASGGGAEPEASDEAVRTVVDALSASARTAGDQTGDFATVFRAEAAKIIILVTDARPGGFDDAYTAGVDDLDVAAISKDAAGKGIRISAVFVPTPASTSNTATITTIMQSYATLSGGEFLQTKSDGSGTAAAITEIIATCGGGGGDTSAISLQLDPPEIFLSNGETTDVAVVNYNPGNDFTVLIYGSDGLPVDSSVTFTRIEPLIPGTDLQRMHVTIGPDTPAGTYILNVVVTRKDSAIVQTNYVLVNVDCVPPLILGTPGHQPQSQTVKVGSTAKFSVAPNGTNAFKYQWFQGHSGSTSFPVVGATNATYTTQALTGPGEYWVRVYSPCGSIDSQTATITTTP
ncbi:MAG: vWA domain-containing protein [Acidobacteriota bacterium]